MESVDIGDAGVFTFKALFGLAVLDMAENDHEECVRHSREALKISPEFVDARFTLAHGLWQMRQLADARAEYERLLAIEPEHNPEWATTPACSRRWGTTRLPRRDFAPSRCKRRAMWIFGRGWPTATTAPGSTRRRATHTFKRATSPRGTHGYV